MRGALHGGSEATAEPVQGLLYGDQLRVVAELDAANQVVSRFAYATRVNVPEFMEKGGSTYRLITDHLGSVRLVVDTATGVVRERIDYDEWGKVTLREEYDAGGTLITPTPAPFQPFGFAGGLYDADTGLVRFGARDYDPQTGRWTTKDPIGFAGGDSNLYGYVIGDPVNYFDQGGTFAQVAGGFVGGALIGASVGGLAGGFRAAALGADVRGILFSAAKSAAIGAAVGGVTGAGVSIGVFTPLQVSAVRAAGGGSVDLFIAGAQFGASGARLPGFLGAFAATLLGSPSDASGAGTAACPRDAGGHGPPGGDELAGQFAGGLGALNRR